MANAMATLRALLALAHITAADIARSTGWSLGHVRNMLSTGVQCRHSQIVLENLLGRAIWSSGVEFNEARHTATLIGFDPRIANRQDLRQVANELGLKHIPTGKKPLARSILAFFAANPSRRRQQPASSNPNCPVVGSGSGTILNMIGTKTQIERSPLTCADLLHRHDEARDQIFRLGELDIKYAADEDSLLNTTDPEDVAGMKVLQGVKLKRNCVPGRIAALRSLQADLESKLEVLIDSEGRERLAFSRLVSETAEGIKKRAMAAVTPFCVDAEEAERFAWGCSAVAKCIALGDLCGLQCCDDWPSKARRFLAIRTAFIEKYSTPAQA
jgi:hypothetical protein